MTCPGHNRLSCAECGVAPEPRPPAPAVPSLPDLARFMAEHKMVRIVYVSGEDRVELERHPSAFALPAPDAETVAKDADRCACGHSLSVEHSETGCYHACAAEECNETGVA